MNERLFDFFTNALDKKYLESIFINNTGLRCVNLTEKSESAKIRKLTLKNLPEKILCIKTDSYEFGQLIGFDNRGFNARCDYVMLSLLGDQLLVHLLELKSSKRIVKKQFRYTELLFKYAIDLAISNMINDLDPQKNWKRVVRIVKYTFYPFNQPKQMTKLKPLLRIEDDVTLFPVLDDSIVWKLLANPR